MDIFPGISSGSNSTTSERRRSSPPRSPPAPDAAGGLDDPDPYPVVLGKRFEILVLHHLEPVQSSQEQDKQAQPDPLEDADPRRDPGVLLPFPDAPLHSWIRCHRLERSTKRKTPRSAVQAIRTASSAPQRAETDCPPSRTRRRVTEADSAARSPATIRRMNISERRKRRRTISLAAKYTASEARKNDPGGPRIVTSRNSAGGRAATNPSGPERNSPA